MLMYISLLNVYFARSIILDVITRALKNTCISSGITKIQIRTCKCKSRSAPLMPLKEDDYPQQGLILLGQYEDALRGS